MKFDKEKLKTNIKKLFLELKNKKNDNSSSKKEILNPKTFNFEEEMKIKENIYVLLKELGKTEEEIEEIFKKSEDFAVPVLEYIINIERLADEEEILKIWSKYYNIPIITDNPIEKKENYIVFANNKIGTIFPFYVKKLKNKYPDKVIGLVPFHLLKIKNVEAEGIRGIFFDIINNALTLKATDIHFEVKEQLLSVKFRILGELKIFENYPLETGKKIIKTIKTLASQYTPGFDPENDEEIQDARIEIKDLNLDLRLAFTPSLVDRVQNLVIRLLLKEQKTIFKKEDIYNLGYFKEDADILFKASNLNNGLVIMSGATGSGKSRTFNTLLALIPPSKKILSVEDPVEYKLPNAVQHQTKEIIISKGEKKEIIKIGYYEYVKEFMRQDPDIIFIGEWRKDTELTESLLYASVTGHLVFTTLHASRVINVPDLLINQYNLKVNDLVNNARLLINQRLVKKVCPNCGEKHIVTKEDIEKLKNKINYLDKDKLDSLIGEEILVRGQGCEKCRLYDNKGNIISYGYSGRTAIYEYLFFTEKVIKGLLQNTISVNVEKILIEDEMSKSYIDTIIKKIKTKQIDLIQAEKGLL